MFMAPEITVALCFRSFAFTRVPDSPSDLYPGLFCISIPSTMLELFLFYSLGLRNNRGRLWAFIPHLKSHIRSISSPGGSACKIYYKSNHFSRSLAVSPCHSLFLLERCIKFLTWLLIYTLNFL